MTNREYLNQLSNAELAKIMEAYGHSCRRCPIYKTCIKNTTLFGGKACHDVMREWLKEERTEMDNEIENCRKCPAKKFCSKGQSCLITFSALLNAERTEDD